MDIMTMDLLRAALETTAGYATARDQVLLGLATAVEVLVETEPGIISFVFRFSPDPSPLETAVTFLSADVADTEVFTGTEAQSLILFLFGERC